MQHRSASHEKFRTEIVCLVNKETKFLFSELYQISNFIVREEESLSFSIEKLKRGLLQHCWPAAAGGALVE